MLDINAQEFGEAEGQISVPFNREAEEAVIGSVLINENVVFEIMHILKAEDFYIHRLRFIWQSIDRLVKAGKTIDLLTVSDNLKNHNDLEEIGGPSFLTSLVNVRASSLNATAYAKIVKGFSARRELLNTASRIATLAYNTEIPINEVVEISMKETSSVELLSTSSHNATMIGDLVDDQIIEARERAKNPKEIWGYETGFPKYDRATGGIHPAELVYVAGQPGVGKTWLALSWATHLSTQAAGAIFSLEMKKSSVARRILSGQSGISSRKMRTGFIEDDELDTLEGVSENIKKYNLLVDDASYSTTKLRAVLREFQRDYGIKWFVLDYAMLLTDKGKDETDQTKIISANLKRIVTDLNIGGIVLQSVTKVGMGRDEQPNMSDQRGSGQAIHDPDIQLFITPPYSKDDLIKSLPKDTVKKMATLWCTKAREVEEMSRFKIHMTRRGSSPFWGEYSRGF